jgi:ABC-type polysaccharide/polyol phosphate transport system ATPase subunit
VIKEIDLTLYQGEMVSLVGHNGAGKSTLSNLILITILQHVTNFVRTFFDAFIGN